MKGKNKGVFFFLQPGRVRADGASRTVCFGFRLSVIVGCSSHQSKKVDFKWFKRSTKHVTES